MILGRFPGEHRPAFALAIKAVLECLAANESTYKFKPSVALKRHQSLNDLDVQDDDVALADASEQVSAKADPAESAVAVAVN